MGTRTCCEHFSVIHLLRNIETVEILLLELPALDTSRVPQLTQQQRPGSWKGLDPFVVVVVVVVFDSVRRYDQLPRETSGADQ